MKEQRHPVIEGFAITVILFLILAVVVLMFFTKWGF